MSLAGNVDIFSNGEDLYWKDPQTGGAAKVATSANLAAMLGETGSDGGAFAAALKDAGFIDDATTDNAPAFQAALAVVIALGHRIAVMPICKNRIRMDSTIFIDRGRITVDFSYNELNWRFSTTHAFEFTCSVSAAEYVRNPVIAQNGFIFRRDGNNDQMRDASWTAGIDAFHFDAAAEPGPGRGFLRNIFTDGFRYGCYIGRNTYLIDHDNVWHLRNCTSICMDNPNNNNGERLYVNGGALWGYRIIYNKGGYIHLNCSLDYPSAGAPVPDALGHYQYIATVTEAGQLHMAMPHLEFRDSGRVEDRAPFYIGAHSLITADNCPLYVADAAADGTALSNSARGWHEFVNYLSLVHFIGNARGAQFTHIARQRTTLFSKGLVTFADGILAPQVLEFSGTDDPFGTGAMAGKSIVSVLGDACQLDTAGTAVLGAAAISGLLADPNMGSATILDGWQFAGTSNAFASGQTTRYAATNWAMTVAGNKAVFTKSAGAAGAAGSTRILLPVPIQKGRVISCKFRIEKTGGAATNPILFQLHRAIEGPTLISGTYAHKQWHSTGQIGNTKTLMTFAGAGAEGPFTFDTLDLAGTLDEGARVLTNSEGTHALLFFDVGVIDASVTPCVISISRVTVSEH